VSLDAGVGPYTVPAVAGVCPTGYVLSGPPVALLPAGALCFLNLATLTAFQNINTAVTTFTAANPGCVLTTTAGGLGTATATPATGTATPLIGENGPTAGQICINALGGIEFGQGATLGTTQVQAIADYPYYRGLHPAVSSAVITKVFTSLFNKSVTVTPKAGSVGPAGTTTYTVTITGVDICGFPIVGEPVQVYALTSNAGSVVLAPTSLPAIPFSTSAATVFLGPTGTATLSLEVLNTALGTGGLVIKAVFPVERLERFFTVIPGQLPNQTVTQLYPPGYNMVGGPPGSNFGASEALFAYDAVAKTYTNVTGSATSLSSAPPTCTGYWSYFAATASVNLPANSTVASPASCTLQPGWNLVGNPFSSAAILPTGTTAYWWNPATQSYQAVGQIPLGGAVWVFNSGSATTTLTLTKS
jgi:hypothetical protein